jgi:hypothetical protein
MPLSSPAVDALLDYTRVVARTLQDASNVTNTPLLKTVSGATMLLMPMIKVRTPGSSEAMYLTDTRIPGLTRNCVCVWSIKSTSCFVHSLLYVRLRGPR